MWRDTLYFCLFDHSNQSFIKSYVVISYFSCSGYKNKIIIFYIYSNNQVTERYIRVLEIKENSILAYCFYRKQVRTFNIKNILSAGKVRKKVGA